uniref:C-type lectin domain-containing protein n=1 Tax=Takifugu rubripes TaxID=31033 RepID=A0A3B5KA54_TAKRU
MSYSFARARLDVHPCATDPRCSRCPAGWIWRKERCYFFSVRLWENLNWNESAEFCWRHNSSLVVLEDPAEMYPNFTFPWVGLTDTQQEGHWVWMDGSDLQRNIKTCLVYILSSQLIYKSY